MATKIRNGNSLGQAMALLIQNQAAFVLQLHEMSKHQVEVSKHQVENDRRFAQHQAESDRRFAQYQVESDRRFARIESELEQIKAILVEHGRVLAGLPEAIRQKVGFKNR
jgi:hypothetical protein